MNPEAMSETNPGIQHALRTLQSRISEQYPQASFSVFHGEDPDGVYLRAVVDTDETDELFDAVADQLYRIQVEQCLPVYLVTTLPLSRVADQLEERRRRIGVQLPR